MRLQIYDLASRTNARERRAYHLLSAERRGASRCEKTTSIGCAIYRASDATMFLMISRVDANAKFPILQNSFPADHQKQRTKFLFELRSKARGCRAAPDSAAFLF